MLITPLNADSPKRSPDISRRIAIGPIDRTIPFIRPVSADPCVIAVREHDDITGFEIDLFRRKGCSCGVYRSRHRRPNPCHRRSAGRGWISVHLWLLGTNTGAPSPGPISFSAMRTLICPTIHSPVFSCRNVRVTQRDMSTAVDMDENRRDPRDVQEILVDRKPH